MSGAYEIEFAEPACSRCACCGGLSVRLTRFVLRSQEAFAVYYASYSNNHPDAELSLLVSLGDWGDESDPSQRVAFYAGSVPPTRRMRSCWTTPPTPSGRTPRSWVGSCHGRRLGPIHRRRTPSSYGAWCVGTWVEVASPDFDRIGDAGDDPQLYPALRFSGTLANDAGAGLELPIPIGAPVAVEVSDPNSAPRISAATLGPLADLLTKTWPKVDFESYAVARGFL